MSAWLQHRQGDGGAYSTCLTCSTWPGRRELGRPCRWCGHDRRSRAISRSRAAGMCGGSSERQLATTRHLRAHQDSHTSQACMAKHRTSPTCHGMWYCRAGATVHMCGPWNRPEQFGAKLQLARPWWMLHSHRVVVVRFQAQRTRLQRGRARPSIITEHSSLPQLRTADVTAKHARRAKAVSHSRTPQPRPVAPSRKRGTPIQAFRKGAGHSDLEYVHSSTSRRGQLLPSGGFNLRAADSCAAVSPRSCTRQHVVIRARITTSGGVCSDMTRSITAACGLSMCATARNAARQASPNREPDQAQQARDQCWRPRSLCQRCSLEAAHRRPAGFFRSWRTPTPCCTAGTRCVS